MFAEVNFAVGKRMAIMVPETALQKRSGLVGIYVVDAQSIAHYRQLRTGEQGEQGVEVLAGLNAGDVIAWRPDGGLRSGMRVKAE